MNIIIEYDGSYPNLCSGKLCVIINNERWDFPDYCLSSGGSVTFDGDWNEDVSSGSWSVRTWPDNFPEDLKRDVLSVINSSIEYGCCGGCV